MSAPSREQGLALVESALAAAAQAASGGEVFVTLNSGRQANTRFARNEITSTGDAVETTVRIGVAFGTRHATAGTNQTDAASLKATAEHAARIARLSPEDPEWMPVLGPQTYLSAAPSFDAATDALGAAERARSAASAIDAAAAQELQAAGFYEHSSNARILGSSAGLRAFHPSTNAEFSSTARTADGTGSGWAAASSYRSGDIDVPALVSVAADKALRSAKPRRLEPGRYTVILEPAAVGSLLNFLVGALDTRRADEGRSFFSAKGGGARVGETIFGKGITLVSDPSDPETPGAPFDGDGLPARPRTWIDKGRLTALRCSRYWARLKGKEATGDISVYKLKGGDATPQGLLKGVKRGVLITRFWYIRSVDPQSILVTGLTRDGVFLVENGEITAPVNNFRFNESPVVMLTNATALSRETKRLPGGFGSRLRVPALRSEGFNLASISDAV